MSLQQRFRTSTTALILTLAAAHSFSGSYGLSQDINPGDLVLRYDPTEGNLAYHYLGTGDSTLEIFILDIITIGDGQTPEKGYLTGVKAETYGTSDTLNTDDGYNGEFSQVFYSNNFGTTSLLTFDSTNNYLNVGNVAPTGWTQTDINTLFITDDQIYEGLNPGHFGYATNDGDFIGSIEVSAVPEPSSVVALIAGASGMLVMAHMRRKTPK